MGEFLAMEAALEHLSDSMDNPKAAVLSECLGEAIENVLMKGKSPTPALHTIDNRGSHFYLAMYWAQHLASQSKDIELASSFASLAEALTSSESDIMNDLSGVQGSPINLQGYFFPSDDVVRAVMRPSETFNQILTEFIA